MKGSPVRVRASASEKTLETTPFCDRRWSARAASALGVGSGSCLTGGGGPAQRGFRQRLRDSRRIRWRAPVPDPRGEPPDASRRTAPAWTRSHSCDVSPPTPAVLVPNDDLLAGIAARDGTDERRGVTAMLRHEVSRNAICLAGAHDPAPNGSSDVLGLADEDIAHRQCDAPAAVVDDVLKVVSRSRSGFGASGTIKPCTCSSGATPALSARRACTTLAHDAPAAPAVNAAVAASTALEAAIHPWLRATFTRPPERAVATLAEQPRARP